MPPFAGSNPAAPASTPDSIREIDLNAVIVYPKGEGAAPALDALILVD